MSRLDMFVSDVIVEAGEVFPEQRKILRAWVEMDCTGHIIILSSGNTRGFTTGLQTRDGIPVIDKSNRYFQDMYLA